jgi:hypothetical protein
MRNGFAAEAAPCIIKIEIVLIVDTEKELLGVVR